MSENIYTRPQKYGLEILTEGDDPDACYSFDKFVVWKDDMDNLYYSTDSGCSCPSPFESQGTEDLIPYLDWGSFDAAVDEWLGGYNETPSQADLMARHEVKMTVAKYLKEKEYRW